MFIDACLLKYVTVLPVVYRNYNIWHVHFFACVPQPYLTDEPKQPPIEVVYVAGGKSPLLQRGKFEQGMYSLSYHICLTGIVTNSKHCDVKETY